MDLLQTGDLPERALVVVAHPDDIDFGIAGTAAFLTDAGCEVVYALCTSGEAGIPEDMPRDELRPLRAPGNTLASCARNASSSAS